MHHFTEVYMTFNFLSNCLCFSTFFNSFFVNLLGVPGSPQCYTSRYDYVDRLMLATISPIVICAILPLIFRIHYISTKRRDDEWFSLIVSQYVAMFLVITYTVLPSVCTTIFAMFSPCVNIDPEGLASTTYSLYLPKDMSIACNSPRYYYGIYWASVMIIIFPFGIPCLYLYLLFLARAEIALRKEKQMHSNRRKTLKVSTRISVSNRDPLRSSINGMENSSSSSINGIHVSYGGDSLDNSVNGRGPPSNEVNGRGSIVNGINGINPPPTLETASGKQQPRDTGDHLLGAVILVANNHAAKILSKESMLKYVVNELEFLHRDYRVNFWYWEIFLTGSKLLLTAVISIIYPGSNDQIVIAWNIAFILMRVQATASPYLDEYDDNLKAIADYQVLLFLIIALIKRNDLLSGAIWQIYFEIILIIIIFSSPIAALWYTFIAPSETVANLRRDYREAKAKAVIERRAQDLKNAMTSGNLRRRGPRSPNVSFRRSQDIDPNRYSGGQLPSSDVSQEMFHNPAENSAIIEEIQLGSIFNASRIVEDDEYSISDDIQLYADNAELGAKAAVELSRKSSSGSSAASYHESLLTSQRQITILPSVSLPFSSTQKVYVDELGADDVEHYNDNNTSNKMTVTSKTTSLWNTQMGNDGQGHNLENNGKLTESYRKGNDIYNEILANSVVHLSNPISPPISRVNRYIDILVAPIE